MILYVHPGTCAGGGIDISGSELEIRMAEFDYFYTHLTVPFRHLVSIRIGSWCYQHNNMIICSCVRL